MRCGCSLRNVTAVAAVALCLAGCPREAAPPQTTLVVALEGSPANLDPRFATDAYSSRVLDAVIRGLLRIDTQGRPQPDLARDWHFTHDRRLVLALRRAHFHDGTTVTADHVAAALNYLRDPANGSPRAAALAPVTAVTAAAEHVYVDMAAPSGPILVALAAPIPHPDELTAETVEAPTGSGPFAVRRINADTLELTPRESMGGIERVRLRTIPDPNARVLTLERGAAHLAQNAVPTNALARIGTLPHLRISRFDGWNVSYMGMQLDHPILSRRKVRKAIATAIDRKAIVKTLLAGTATLTNSLIPPANWAYAKVTQPIVHDPDRARRLLDAAGYPNPEGPQPRFRLQYKTSTNPERIRQAQAIAADLEKVGIEINVRSLEFATFFEDVRKGNFELYSLTWVGVVEPDLLHYALHSQSMPPNGANRGGWRDPALDTLLDRARHTLERAARAKLYAQAQTRIAATLPVIPLWVHDTVIVQHRDLSPVTPLPGGGLRMLAGLRYNRAAISD